MGAGWEMTSLSICVRLSKKYWKWTGPDRSEAQSYIAHRLGFTRFHSTQTLGLLHVPHHRYVSTVGVAVAHHGRRERNYVYHQMGDP